MMAEAAEHNGLTSETAELRAAAAELRQAIHENLWREDKGRYIAGIAYNEDGYEDIDFKWENIGFDYIWALTLPDDEHLPFSAPVKQACLEAAYRAEAWANTNFGMAELATDLCHCAGVAGHLPDCTRAVSVWVSRVAQATHQHSSQSVSSRSILARSHLRPRPALRCIGPFRSY